MVLKIKLCVPSPPNVREGCPEVSRFASKAFCLRESATKKKTSRRRLFRISLRIGFVEDLSRGRCRGWNSGLNPRTVPDRIGRKIGKNNVRSSSVAREIIFALLRRFLLVVKIPLQGWRFFAQTGAVVKPKLAINFASGKSCKGPGLSGMTGPSL